MGQPSSFRPSHHPVLRRGTVHLAVLELSSIRETMGLPRCSGRSRPADLALSLPAAPDWRVLGEQDN